MLMEENSNFLMRRIWGKLLLPSVIRRGGTFIATSICGFLLISRFCSSEELVIFSIFIPVQQLKKMFDNYFAVGGTQQFSMMKGAGDPEESRKVFSDCLWGHILIAGAFYGSLCLGMPVLTHICKFPENLIADAISFGRPLAIFYWLSSLNQILLFFLNSDSLPRQASCISLVNNFSMLVFQIVFIGFLKKGLDGYLYSVFLAEGICLTACLTIILTGKSTLSLKFHLPRLKTLRQLWNFSGFMIIQAGISFFGKMVINTLILGCPALGKTGLAIYAFGGQIYAIICNLYTGFNDTTQLLTSMFRGEKSINGQASTWRRGMLWGGLFAMITTALLCMAIPWIVRYMPALQESYPNQAAWASCVMLIGQFIFFFMDFHICFYAACGHAKLVSFCAMFNQIFVRPGCPLLFILAANMFNVQKWFWFSYVADAVIQFSVVVVMAEIVRRRFHYSNHMLLREEEKIPRSIFFTIKNSIGDLEDYQTMLLLFLRRNKADKEQIKRAKLLFEELFIFATERMKPGKDDFFFFSTSIQDDEKLLFTLKYDSKESCFNSVLNGEQWNLPLNQLSGAKIIYNLAENVRLDRVFGINIIRLELGQKRETAFSDTKSEVCI